MRRIWRALKFVIYDWTVTPRMLKSNEQHPFLYQLVTTPIITVVVGAGLATAMVIGSTFLGLYE